MIKKILLICILSLISEKIFAEELFNKEKEEENESGQNFDEKTPPPELPPDHPCNDEWTKDYFAGKKGTNWHDRGFNKK